MRTNPSIPAVALACLLSLTACNRPKTELLGGLMQTSSGQTDQAKDDAVITSLVKAALAADEEVDGTNISVTTKYGHVTLRGTVPAARQIRRAEEVVRSIDGVRHVNNRLKPVGVLA